MKEYFEKLNGYFVKDNDAREQIEQINVQSVVNFIAPSLNADFGDCSVLNVDDKTIIVDLGNDATASPLVNYLMDNEIHKIDYVIISHYHEDHISGPYAEGLNVLLNNNYFDFTDCKFILPHGAINYASAIPSNSLEWVRTIRDLIVDLLDSKGIQHFEPVEDGYTIELNDLQRMKFYNLDSSYYNDYYNYTISFNTEETNKTNYNNFSMVMVFENGNTNVLFTGDIEYPSEKNISKFLKNIELMKVEHHGLNTRTHNDYIDRLSPKYLVVGNRQFYNTPFDFERDTVSNLMLKGALCFDTRSYSSNFLRFKIVNDDVVSMQESSKLVWNPALDLLAGEQLLYGQDLNDITEPGTYYSVSGTRTASLINKPETIDGTESIGTGFKMIVSRTYNTDGDYLTQMIIQSNAIFSRVYMRNSINGSFDGSYWMGFIPSHEVYYDNSYFNPENEKSFINALYRDITSDNTWLVKKNGYVTINFDFTLNVDVGASYANLLSLKYNLARPNANVEFCLTSADGGVYPMYLRYNNNEVQLRTRGKAIASGTTLRGSVTYALNRLTS